MIKFLRKFTERFKQKIVRSKYRVHWEMTYDGDVIDRFTIIIVAKSQEHAWRQLASYIKIKPVRLERVKDSEAAKMVEA